MHVPVGSEIELIKKVVRCPENYEVPVIIGIGYAKEKIHIDKF